MSAARAAREGGAGRARRPLRGFPPVIAAGAHTLILGSFPSEASLAAGHYYAHPRNQFWTILGDALGEPLASLPFEARYRAVTARGLAIWDVLSACHREGSLDADIREASPNDFEQLRHLAPGLRRVLFNGRTAGRFEPLFAAQGYETAVLPSTSPANASWSLARKREAWLAALAPSLA